MARTKQTARVSTGFGAGAGAGAAQGGAMLPQGAAAQAAFDEYTTNFNFLEDDAAEEAEEFDLEFALMLQQQKQHGHMSTEESLFSPIKLKTQYKPRQFDFRLGELPDGIEINGAYKFEKQPDKGTALVLAKGSSITMRIGRTRDDWDPAWVANHTVKAVVHVAPPAPGQTIPLLTLGDDSFGVSAEIGSKGELGTNVPGVSENTRQQCQNMKNQLKQQQAQARGKKTVVAPPVAAAAATSTFGASPRKDKGMAVNVTQTFDDKKLEFNTWAQVTVATQMSQHVGCYVDGEFSGSIPIAEEVARYEAHQQAHMMGGFRQSGAAKKAHVFVPPPVHHAHHKNGGQQGGFGGNTLGNQNYSQLGSAFLPTSLAETATLFDGAHNGIKIRFLSFQPACEQAQQVFQNLHQGRSFSHWAAVQEEERLKRYSTLCLRELYRRPPPIWAHPAFTAMFGDPFFTDVGIASSHSVQLAVLRIALRQLLDVYGQSLLEEKERSVVGNVAVMLGQCEALFRKFPAGSNHKYIAYLRKYFSPQINQLVPGGKLVVPVAAFQDPILFLIERFPDSYRLVVISTDPFKGLKYHATDAQSPPKIKFKTCLVIPDIKPEKIRDPGFWAMCFAVAQFNSMDQETDPRSEPMHGLYERILPWIVDKPLDVIVRDGIDAPGADWRTPQRSQVASLKVFTELLHFLLRDAGVSKLRAKVTQLGLRVAFLDLALSDLRFVARLDASERQMIRIGCEQAALAATKLSQSEEPLDVNQLVYVKQTIDKLEEAADKLPCPAGTDAPPPECLLDDGGYDAHEHDELPLYDLLLRKETVDHLAGAIVPPRTYVPVDCMQMPQRVTNYDEALHAIRFCDKLCTLIMVQPDFVKNGQQLISAMVTRIFTQVLPVPRARGNPGFDKCLWAGMEFRFERQLDVMILLQRIVEHFVASHLSLQPRDPNWEAALITVPACIAAVADVVMRKRATDIPSEVCLHLIGENALGEQVSAGYGVTTGYLEQQAATVQCFQPEVAVALTAAADYFASQHEARKIFQWDRGNRFDRNTLRYLGEVAMELAFPLNLPGYLVGGLIIKNFPEFACYRDITFYMLYVQNSENLIGQGDYMQLHAQLSWSLGQNLDVVVQGFGGNQLECMRTKPLRHPSVGDLKLFFPESNSPKRFGGGAGQGAARGNWRLNPPVRTEDDILHVKNLPVFEDAISSEDSQLLMSYLTVPYLRLPLIVTFFSTEDRIHALRNEQLQNLLTGIVFEPGNHLPFGETRAPAMVPTQRTQLLASAYGMLLNELNRSPVTLCKQLLSMLQQAIALDTGNVEQSTTVIILFLIRTLCRFESFLAFLIDYNDGTLESMQVEMRGMEFTPRNLAMIREGLAEIRTELRGRAFKIVEHWVEEVGRKIREMSDINALDSQTQTACKLHAHLLLIFRNVKPAKLTPVVASVLTSSSVFLLTRHTWNQGILPIKDLETYELLEVTRRRLVEAMRRFSAFELSEVLEASVRVASSTGNRRSKGRPGKGARHLRCWGYLQGPRSVGRFTPSGLRVQAGEEVEVPLVEDEDGMEVEIDVQLMQLTLKKSHLRALDRNIAQHHDVVHVFGHRTMQVSTIEDAQHRQWLRLVGRNHDIQFWNSADPRPFISDDDREYEPGELEEAEQWIVELFEPIRLTFFNNPMNPTPFVLPDEELPADARVAKLTGLQPRTYVPFIEVYVLRDLRSVHIYSLHSWGRRFYRTLVFASDARFCLRELQPPAQGRQHPWRPWERFLAGNPQQSVAASPQPIISRGWDYSDNLSGGTEQFIPLRLLTGTLPQALLDAYDFWEAEDDSLTGYPRDPDCPHVIRVSHRPAAGFSHTALPTELLQVTRLPKAEHRAAFEATLEVYLAISRSKTLFKCEERVADLLKASPRRIRRKKQEDDAATQAQQGRRRQQTNNNANQAKLMQQMQSLGVPMHNAPRQKKASGFGGGGGGFGGAAAAPAPYRSGVSLDDMIDELGAEDYTRRRAPEGGAPDADAGADATADADKELSADLDLARDEFAKPKSVAEMDAEETHAARSVGLASPYHLFQACERVRAAQPDLARLRAAVARYEAEGAEFTAVADLVTRLAADADADADATDTSGTADADANNANNAAKGQAGRPLEGQRLVLLNLAYAPRESRLNCLARVLARLENCAHVLAWTREGSAGSAFAGDLAAIHLVELPRLKLSFQVQVDPAGVPQLFSLDHADLFVTNFRDAHTTQLIRGMPHSLLMSNANREIQILVPALHPVRPVILSSLFSTELVIDRGAKRWWDTMETMYFLYPVHVSLTFLFTPTLASGLYLMLLRFLNRDYPTVYRLADTIGTDTRYGEAEGVVYKALGESNGDTHPDATACRNRIAYVTMDSPTPLPWDLTRNVAQAALTASHASAACRLSPVEARQLLERCITDEHDERFDKALHTVYMVRLTKNRSLHLEALAEGFPRAKCYVAPRRACARSAWPAANDPTVLALEQAGSSLSAATVEQLTPSNSNMLNQGAAAAKVKLFAVHDSDAISPERRAALEALMADFAFCQAYSVRMDQANMLGHGQDHEYILVNSPSGHSQQTRTYNLDEARTFVAKQRPMGFTGDLGNPKLVFLDKLDDFVAATGQAYHIAAYHLNHAAPRVPAPYYVDPDDAPVISTGGGGGGGGGMRKRAAAALAQPAAAPVPALAPGAQPGAKKPADPEAGKTWGCRRRLRLPTEMVAKLQLQGPHPQGGMTGLPIVVGVPAEVAAEVPLFPGDRILAVGGALTTQQGAMQPGQAYPALPTDLADKPLDILEGAILCSQLHRAELCVGQHLTCVNLCAASQAAQRSARGGRGFGMGGPQKQPGQPGPPGQESNHGFFYHCRLCSKSVCIVCADLEKTAESGAFFTAPRACSVDMALESVQRCHKAGRPVAPRSSFGFGVELPALVRHSHLWEELSPRFNQVIKLQAGQALDFVASIMNQDRVNGRPENLMGQTSAFGFLGLVRLMTGAIPLSFATSTERQGHTVAVLLQRFMHIPKANVLGSILQVMSRNPDFCTSTTAAQAVRPMGYKNRPRGNFNSGGFGNNNNQQNPGLPAIVQKLLTEIRKDPELAQAVAFVDPQCGEPADPMKDSPFLPCPAPADSFNIDHEEAEGSRSTLVPALSNFMCGERRLTPMTWPDEAGQLAQLAVAPGLLAELGSRPLDTLGVAEETVLLSRAERGLEPVGAELPFDVSAHEQAYSKPARELIERLRSDIAVYSAQMNEGGVLRMARFLDGACGELVGGTATPEAAAGARAHVEELVARLTALREDDRAYVHEAQRRLLALSNHVALPEAGQSDARERYEFVLLRYSRAEPRFWLEYLFGSLLSSDAFGDMQQVNPYLPAKDMANILDVIAATLLRANRVGQINRCLSDAHDVLALLARCDGAAAAALPEAARKALQAGLVQKTEMLATNLRAKRQYVEAEAAESTAPESTTGGGALTYDPRFLVFEFTWNLMLRESQVELILDILRRVRAGGSTVKQMIMGAGKTTVISPLIALMLADGSSLMMQVVPPALLEFSRSVMRTTFSSIMYKRVYTLTFDRSATISPKLRTKLDNAVRTRGVVMGSPTAVKSLMLKYMELLDLIRDEAQPAASKLLWEEQALELAKVLRLFRSGILVMDEVDLILHPLKSELNFPVGAKHELDLAPRRWELAVHVLDGVFYADRGRMSVGFEESQLAKSICERLLGAIREGYATCALQRNPHIVLLNPEWYHATMKPVLAEWTFLWLSKQHIGTGRLRREHVIEFLLEPWAARNRALHELLAGALSAQQMKLMNLAHDVLRSYLPHCLQKIDRVSFGIMNKLDHERALRYDPRMPQSRAKLAIPFVGKDVPSRSSEFAHPDIIIGLTVLAYRYEGLRWADFDAIMESLARSYGKEVGQPHRRKTSVLYATWIALAGGTMHGHVLSGDMIEVNPTPADADLLHDSTEEDPREVMPLWLLDRSNDAQMRKVFDLLRLLPEVLHWYLLESIFPAHMQHQVHKLSASGQAIGGSMLFDRRIGFSGTPSDLLPIELGRCGYERGTDGKIITVMADPAVVSTEVVADGWTVASLLDAIANPAPAGGRRFHALIDSGALITGMTNEQVARHLLAAGLAWCEGVVFLDDNDRKVIVVRSTGRVIHLEQCGIAKAKRFSFYDQIHTTGMDIKHTLNATAVLTLGKDMVFRDFAQGAFRMRGIGKGQTIHVFVIPEVNLLMRRELESARAAFPAGPRGFLLRISAWLVINSMRSERVQYNQLCVQNLCNVWRKNAGRALFEGAAAFTPGREVGDVLALRALEVFREPVDYSIEPGIPEILDLGSVLKAKLAENAELVRTDEERAVAQRVIHEVEQQWKALVAAGLKETDVDPSKLDTTATKEEEREQEKEVEDEREREVHRELDLAYARDHEAPERWDFATLAAAPGPAVPQFYPAHKFALHRRRPLRLAPGVHVSNNYFHKQWSGDRKIKDVVMTLEWIPSLAALRYEPPTAAPPSESQQTALRKAFQLLDVKNAGVLDADAVVLATRTMLSVALTPAQAGELIVAFEGPAAPGLGLDGLRRLLQSGRFREVQQGRQAVLLSLAEAETIRRIMHVRLGGAVVEGSDMAVALRCSAHANLVFDESEGFAPAMSRYQTDAAWQLCRFINSEMYFTTQQLTTLIRVLQDNSIHERRRFFTLILGCRRRTRKKHAEAPIAKAFRVTDEWFLHKLRALAARVRHAIRAKGLKVYDACTFFDANKNGALSPAELFGAFEWLGVPAVEAADVLEFVRAMDLDGDGHLSHLEFLESLRAGAAFDAASGAPVAGAEEDDEEDDGIDASDSERVLGILRMTSVGGTEHEQVVPKEPERLVTMASEWSAKDRRDEDEYVARELTEEAEMRIRLEEEQDELLREKGQVPNPVVDRDAGTTEWSLNLDVSPRGMKWYGSWAVRPTKIRRKLAASAAALRPGSWYCDVCFTENSVRRSPKACRACGAPRPRSGPPVLAFPGNSPGPAAQAAAAAAAAAAEVLDEAEARAREQDEAEYDQLFGRAKPSGFSGKKPLGAAPGGFGARPGVGLGGGFGTPSMQPRNNMPGMGGGMGGGWVGGMGGSTPAGFAAPPGGTTGFGMGTMKTKVATQAVAAGAAGQGGVNVINAQLAQLRQQQQAAVARGDLATNETMVRLIAVGERKLAEASGMPPAPPLPATGASACYNAVVVETGASLFLPVRTLERIPAWTVTAVVQITALPEKDKVFSLLQCRTTHHPTAEVFWGSDGCIGLGTSIEPSEVRLQTGRWHVITCAVTPAAPDGAAATLAFYIDGAQALHATLDPAGARRFAVFEYVAFFGSEEKSMEGGGLLQWARLHSRTLSPAEVAEDASDVGGRFTAGSADVGADADKDTPAPAKGAAAAAATAGTPAPSGPAKAKVPAVRANYLPTRPDAATLAAVFKNAKAPPESAWGKDVPLDRPSIGSMGFVFPGAGQTREARAAGTVASSPPVKFGVSTAATSAAGFGGSAFSSKPRRLSAGADASSAAAPAKPTGGFGSSPSGFGSSPSGFGSSTSGFGSSTSGFGGPSPTGKPGFSFAAKPASGFGTSTSGFRGKAGSAGPSPTGKPGFSSSPAAAKPASGFGSSPSGFGSSTKPASAGPSTPKGGSTSSPAKLSGEPDAPLSAGKPGVFSFGSQTSPSTSSASGFGTSPSKPASGSAASPPKLSFSAFGSSAKPPDDPPSSKPSRKSGPGFGGTAAAKPAATSTGLGAATAAKPASTGSGSGSGSGFGFGSGSGSKLPFGSGSGSGSKLSFGSGSGSKLSFGSAAAANPAATATGFGSGFGSGGGGAKPAFTSGFGGAPAAKPASTAFGPSTGFGSAPAAKPASTGFGSGFGQPGSSGGGAPGGAFGSAASGQAKPAGEAEKKEKDTSTFKFKLPPMPKKK